MVRLKYVYAGQVYGIINDATEEFYAVYYGVMFNWRNEEINMMLWRWMNDL